MRKLVVLTALTGIGTSAAGDVFLNFEGICPPDNSTTPIGAFYASLGVFFTDGGSNARAIVDSDEGGNAQGNFANEPSSKTIMFFMDGPATIMNVPAGFTTGFSTYYTTIAATGTVEVYDGLDGTGNLLGSAPVFALGSDPNGGDPTGQFNRWDLVDIVLGPDDVARSVKFIGAASLVGFDDMVFGAVPAPAACLLPGLAPLLVPHRRRQSPSGRVVSHSSSRSSRE